MKFRTAFLLVLLLSVPSAYGQVVPGGGPNGGLPGGIVQSQGGGTSTSNPPGSSLAFSGTAVARTKITSTAGSPLNIYADYLNGSDTTGNGQISSFATFTATTVGTAMTVSGVTGTITAGMKLTGTGWIAGTTISSGSGTNWVINQAQTPSDLTSVATTGYIGTPYQTADAALYYACNSLDFTSQPQAVVQANVLGVDTAGVHWACHGSPAPGSQGDAAIVLNFFASGSIATATNNTPAILLGGARLAINNPNLSAANSNSGCVQAQRGGYAQLQGAVTWEGCLAGDVVIVDDGIVVNNASSQTDTGAGTTNYHVNNGNSSNQGGGYYDDSGRNLSYTANRAYTAFIYTASGVSNFNGSSFTTNGHTISGKHFVQGANGVIQSGGTDLNTLFPGNSNGTYNLSNNDVFTLGTASNTNATLAILGSNTFTADQTIQESGNARLNIQATATNIAYLMLQHNGGNNFQIQNDGSNHFTIQDTTNGGDILTGTAAAMTIGGSSATALTLNGTVTAANLATVGTIAGSLCATSGGLILYESGVTGCTISLRGLKRDIDNVSTSSALAEVMRMQPVAFNFKEGDDKRRVGFVAEDVAAVDARCSTYDGNGKLQAYDPNCVIALLTAAVQAQQKEISALMAK